MSKIFWVAAASLALAGCVTSSSDRIDRAPAAAAASPQITWQVDHRFRLMADKDEERFYRDLSAYALEYDAWFKPRLDVLATDLIHPESKTALQRDYAVNYDVRTHSYLVAKQGETDWITDPRRAITLRASHFGAGDCVWTFGERQRAPERCDALVQEIVDINTPIVASVRSLSDGRASSTNILVRDIKIVAFGDSFSAGEGNPHTQWRSWHVRKRPATWLDPRCHRSLLSGPSLTAAYLARQNPHLSVTFLHYACSGASIYDGVVTPWSLLETAQRANRRYIDRGYDLAEIPPSQVAASLGPYDIAPSQIDMAIRDLTRKEGLITPDIVLLSVGGNDVGFAKIVNSLANRWDVDPDLRPTPENDDRAVLTFDDAEWKIADPRAPCAEIAGKRPSLVKCMGQRVSARSEQMLHNKAPEKPAGFDVVAQQLARLDVAPSAIYVTAYPNFVIRERHDETARTADDASSGDVVGCNDQPFDGRAALVPVVGTWVPRLGLRGRDAILAGDEFMTPINGAIAGAADRHHWNFVDGHLARDGGHGYCARRRYHNTLLDSHWNQGSTYRGSRPLGNFVIRAADGRSLPVDRPVIWNAGLNCFTTYPAPFLPSSAPSSDCLRDVEGREPIRYVLSRTKPAQVDQGGLANSTGAVHPNYLGHCSYAAAIIAKIAAVAAVPPAERVRYADALDPAFLDRSVSLGAEALCRPEAWGYALKAGAQP